ncbi:Glycoside hydrolase, superfamily [Lasallia pustulata]|uniref:glucan 1,3-beta-glucosidase n=1 Tax=Lasallia pustulata TaxID=136370 RepID=A0A1W5D9T7_9LECA|nr:Glycoside hydrolase, superfamily [Lasallia pustulata]
MADARKEGSPSKARPRPKSGEDGRKPRASNERKSKSTSRSPVKKTTSRSPVKKTAVPIAQSSSTSNNSSQALSSDALAKLDAANEKSAAAVAKEREKREKREKAKELEVKHREKVTAGRVLKEKYTRRKEGREKRRVVSGPLLEEGRGRRGGFFGDPKGRRKFGRGTWLLIGLVVLLLIILIPVGVVVAGKNKSGSSSPSTSGTPSNSNLNGINANDIPPAAKGSILDPFTWHDTTDFNVTYTNATVGGLPIMGLNSTWDDTARANNHTPPLNQSWTYGPTAPVRGVNLGGWLSLEPFITPSLFDSYQASMNIVDEYTLTQHLGATQAAQTLEAHYATFVTEQTFADIRAAGLDHVRIPYSYWAITTYPGDPYVPKISWRYLLRGIEWARKHGLRVNLDLHALPGSQNGWNHSGRQGAIGWLNGTDGALNAQRSLDLHTQLAAFFAQPRYENVLAFYGLVNEPRMTRLLEADVLAWTTSAVQIVRQNGIKAFVVFADGFLGLSNWQGKLQGIPGLVLDAHQYVIFNQAQIAFPHQNKLDFACSGWTSQTEASMNPATGFGPTLCGEWSQADTDCAPSLNNVNVGSRWTGTLNTGDPSTQILTPSCPPNAGACDCTPANADPASYSDAYKTWLLRNAEAQMDSFEQGWGWFYWTWVTETAVQWSWRDGMVLLIQDLSGKIDNDGRHVHQ